MDGQIIEIEGQERYLHIGDILTITYPIYMADGPSILVRFSLERIGPQRMKFSPEILGGEFKVEGSKTVQIEPIEMRIVEV